MDNSNKTTSTNKDQGSRDSLSRNGGTSADVSGMGVSPSSNRGLSGGTSAFQNQGAELLKNMEPLKERGQQFVQSSETVIRQNLWISIFGATAVGAILGMWLRGSK